MRFWSWLRELFVAPNFRADPGWVAADRYHRELLKDFVKGESPAPFGGSDLDSALDFAKFLYEEATKVSEQLDAKATTLFQYETALAGAILTAMKSFNFGMDWLTVAGFVILFLSTAISIRARTPVRTGMPMDADKVLRTFEAGYPDAYVEAHLVSSFHAARAAINVINEWKASLIVAASWSFLFGLAVLGIGLML
jgi:hypothetical protein